MEAFDPAAEWLQLSERYRQMSDNELLALARQITELTDAAQQILTSEMSRRGLKLQPEEPPGPPIPARQLDPSYDEDRKLVEILTVWSLSDAVQLQTLLDGAGIPFFMGPEKATSVETVTSSFVNGVSVQIMQVGLPWARQVLMNYSPANDPGPRPGEELRDLSVRCPKCHSTEIVLERLLSEPAIAADDSQKYEWTCDSCGHHWEDDGVVEEE
jgi:DNA-directed RNA polymerase subunit M/transcription elongation factor TFIIS